MVSEILRKYRRDDGYIIRTLEENDYDKGYFDLLQQLTSADKPSFEDFKKKLQEIEKTGIITIFVVEFEGKIVANTTNIREPKFIRNLMYVDHIEEVVVDKDHRNNKLGSSLLQLSIDFARESNCYKIILDTTDTMVGYYSKQGFNRKGNQMVIYL